MLTTADHRSAAHGHCTFYFDTGTGVCIYTGGNHDLAEFHAVFVIGLIPPDGACCSVIGKYSLGGSDSN